MLTDLPDELLLSIVSYAPVIDVTRLACVCRHLRAVCDDNSVWEPLIESRFPNARIPKYVLHQKTSKQKYVAITYYFYKIVLTRKNSYAKYGMHHYVIRGRVLSAIERSGVINCCSIPRPAGPTYHV